MRAALFMVVLLAGCGKDRDLGGYLSSSSEPKSSKPANPGSAPVIPDPAAIRVAPGELSQAYTYNPAAADRKYKGKTIEIEMPWLMERQGGETIVRSGRLVYRFASEDEAAKVEPSTVYLVRGRCDGLMGNSLVISSVRIVGITRSN